MSKKPRIENDLLSRSQEAVTRYDIQDQSINFNGRDATIEGVVSSEDIKMKIERAIKSERGVRVVNNLLTVAKPEPLPQIKKTEILQNKLNDFIKENNIEFRTNTAIIERVSLPTIDQISKLLNEYTKDKIQIVGHADSRGSDKYNINLSQRRAEAVLLQLVNRGVTAARLEAKGLGRSVPIADNNTAEGRQKNRRVEFKIMEKE